MPRYCDGCSAEMGAANGPLIQQTVKSGAVAFDLRIYPHGGAAFCRYCIIDAVNKELDNRPLYLQKRAKSEQRN